MSIGSRMNQREQWRERPRSRGNVEEKQKGQRAKRESERCKTRLKSWAVPESL